MLNDLKTINKIKEGDIKTFESVFRRYYSPLCLYAFSLTRQHEIAEEIVQEVFYVCWKERENLNIFFSLKSYLYKAVRNRSFQYYEHLEVRKRHTEKVMAEPETNNVSDPHSLMEYKELEEIIHTTLKKLPERRSQIFKLHRHEGKKYTEIASMLSLSVKTVEAEMTKTLQILKKEIELYSKSK